MDSKYVRENECMLLKWECVGHIVCERLINLNEVNPYILIIFIVEAFDHW